MSELDQYDYELPRELIAQEPLRNRSDARLLIVDRTAGTLADHHIRDLPQFISSADCLVLNDTRVVPARLVGVREKTGGRWSGLFLEADSTGMWQVMSKTRGKLQAGEMITLFSAGSQARFQLCMLSQLEDGTWIACPQAEGETFELLDQVGRVPLPPYIRGGEMLEEDRQRYQTVYAVRQGAIAAPTAGLHFTPELLLELRRRGVAMCGVTLHVGAGTFRPITSETLSEHRMHAEWGEVSEEAVDQIRATRKKNGRVIAVGTTVVRLLETASATGTLQPWTGKTDLFIRPPYTFRSVDALLTNFHLPRSTLLILVRTFGGDELMRKAYEHAIKEGYRFFSYGDAMLIV